MTTLFFFNHIHDLCNVATITHPLVVALPNLLPYHNTKISTHIQDQDSENDESKNYISESKKPIYWEQKLSSESNKLSSELVAPSIREHSIWALAWEVEECEEDKPEPIWWAKMESFQVQQIQERALMVANMYPGSIYQVKLQIAAMVKKCSLWIPFESSFSCNALSHTTQEQIWIWQQWISQRL